MFWARYLGGMVTSVASNPVRRVAAQSLGGVDGLCAGERATRHMEAKGSMRAPVRVARTPRWYTAAMWRSGYILAHHMHTTCTLYDVTVVITMPDVQKIWLQMLVFHGPCDKIDVRLRGRDRARHVDAPG